MGNFSNVQRGLELLYKFIPPCEVWYNQLIHGVVNSFKVVKNGWCIVVSVCHFIPLGQLVPRTAIIGFLLFSLYYIILHYLLTHWLFCLTNVLISGPSTADEVDKLDVLPPTRCLTYVPCIHPFYHLETKFLQPMFIIIGCITLH